MSTNGVSRRDLIQQGALTVAAVGMLPFIARRALAAACADPDDSLRMSLHYAEKAPEAAKSCTACSFFTPDTGGCGMCKIFNGPANPAGHCDSWSAKS